MSIHAANYVVISPNVTMTMMMEIIKCLALMTSPPHALNSCSDQEGRNEANVDISLFVQE